MIQDAHAIAAEIQRLLVEGDLEQVVITDRKGRSRHGVVLEQWEYHVGMSRVLTVDHIGHAACRADDAGFIIDVDYMPTSNLNRPMQRSAIVDRALEEMQPNFAHLARSRRVVCLGHGNLGLALREWVFTVDRGVTPPPTDSGIFGPRGLPVAVAPRTANDDGVDSGRHLVGTSR